MPESQPADVLFSALQGDVLFAANSKHSTASPLEYPPVYPEEHTHAAPDCRSTHSEPGALHVLPPAVTELDEQSWTQLVPSPVNPALQVQTAPTPDSLKRQKGFRER